MDQVQRGAEPLRHGARVIERSSEFALKSRGTRILLMSSVMAIPSWKLFNR